MMGWRKNATMGWQHNGMAKNMQQWDGSTKYATMGWQRICNDGMAVLNMQQRLCNDKICNDGMARMGWQH